MKNVILFVKNRVKKAGFRFRKFPKFSVCLAFPVSSFSKKKFFLTKFDLISNRLLSVLLNFNSILVIFASLGLYYCINRFCKFDFEGKNHYFIFFKH